MCGDMGHEGWASEREGIGTRGSPTRVWRLQGVSAEQYPACPQLIPRNKASPISTLAYTVTIDNILDIGDLQARS
jgi:hypothetical protein